MADVEIRVAKTKTKVDPRVNISVDQTFEDVLGFDEKGKLLVFDHEPGRFLELSEKQVSQLSYHNKGAYFVSKEMFRGAVAEAEPDFLKGLSIMQGASPTARLGVKGLRPGMHGCWKRDDEVAGCLREGYTVVQGDEVETFASRVGSAHTLGAKGNVEMVLMEIPQAAYMARIKAAEQVSQRRVKGAEATAVAEMRQGGGIPFESSDDTSGGWKVVDEDE